MGGSNADITPVESATGLLQRFQSLTLANTGSFINYDGKALAL
jgi:hypothetical protein